MPIFFFQKQTANRLNFLNNLLVWSMVGSHRRVDVYFEEDSLERDFCSDIIFEILK